MNLWEYCKVAFCCILVLVAVVLIMTGFQAVIIDTGRAIVH